MTYSLVKNFKKKYPWTVTWWRLKKHSKLLEKYLHSNEKVLYAFAGQNDNIPSSFFNTAVIALTTERLIVAQNRLIVGYDVAFVTPDLYNDLRVDAGLLWGTITIDTVKELIHVSKLSNKSLPEIQEAISSYMIKAKKQYKQKEKKVNENS
ncbi:MAG: PH domain-containing protein [Bacilli bacterium]|nr:PH domain-containing protein [Bacilli bacterium]